MSISSDVPPAWYPDPADPTATRRWWDGTAWTATTEPLDAAETALPPDLTSWNDTQAETAAVGEETEPFGHNTEPFGHNTEPFGTHAAVPVGTEQSYSERYSGEAAAYDAGEPSDAKGSGGFRQRLPLIGAAAVAALVIGGGLVAAGTGGGSNDSTSADETAANTATDSETEPSDIGADDTAADGAMTNGSGETGASSGADSDAASSDDTTSSDDTSSDDTASTDATDADAGTNETAWLPPAPGELQQIPLGFQMLPATDDGFPVSDSDDAASEDDASEDDASDEATTDEGDETDPNKSTKPAAAAAEGIPTWVTDIAGDYPDGESDNDRGPSDIVRAYVETNDDAERVVLGFELGPDATDEEPHEIGVFVMTSDETADFVAVLTREAAGTSAWLITANSADAPELATETALEVWRADGSTIEIEVPADLLPHGVGIKELTFWADDTAASDVICWSPDSAC